MSLPLGNFSAGDQEALTKIVGSSYVFSDADHLTEYGRDWTRSVAPNAAVVVQPASTKEVAEIMRYCHAKNLAVMPSGGRTGLAGGAVAVQREVVLSLDRLNKIEKIDAVGMTIEVQAGVTCQAVQEAAANAGMFFALDLASKGSCQIGGNLATNAGGLKLIRYGGAREQVLGIEVVLADGTILDMNYSLRKNNTGPDLKQLFIGSEGILGIITKAVLRLVPRPLDLQISCMAVRSFGDIPKFVKLCNQQSISPTALEFFSDEALDIVLKYNSHLRSPFKEKTAFYLLLELDSAGQADTMMQPILEQAMEQDLIADAVISSNSAQFKELWSLRENISESISNCGHVRKNDISLPIDCLDRFVAQLEEVMGRSPKEIQMILFGHIGDGNLHINYIGPSNMPKPEFSTVTRKIEEEIFALLPGYRGSISAEHGVGLLKKADLKYSRSPTEIAWMKQLKQLFDPKGILNPSKVL